MKSITKFGITLFIGFSLVFLIACLKDIFSQTEAVKVFHILVDGFFAVGVVITSAGLLVFSSNEGTFDMLVYGVSYFFSLFRKNMERKYETFYDYRCARAEKKLKFGFLLISGLILLAISAVMYGFYRMYK
jgi:hypothetical protein